VDCHGRSICIHEKIKKTCVDCNSSLICIHGKRKNICVDCHGRSICIHEKIKGNCKECNIGLMCIHDKIKYNCKKCHIGYRCEHNKEKRYCKECHGSSICIHGKIKYTCKECGGSGRCEHNKRREICKECKGSSICRHGKEKSSCKECGGSRLCKSDWCETFGNNKYRGYCLLCFIHLYPDEPNVRNYKTKEKTVVDRITETFTNFTWVADKKVQDGCSRRRPDLLLDMGSHIIIVEIDEKKHTVYDCSCENKRLMELSQDLQHRPIVFIRFNPDSYTNQNGILIKSCWRLNKTGTMQIMNTKQIEWEERILALKEQIQYWIDNPTEKTIEIIQLFY
jgi:hypothetical protein